MGLKIKVVPVTAVVRELEFQKKEMIDYMKEWKVDDDIIDMATTHFDDVIHGVEDHLQHYHINVEG